MTRYENSLQVACPWCEAAIGRPCEWMIAGYVDEPKISHPIRYIAATKPMRSEWALHIYISAARRWESHRCGSVEIREYLRAVWRRAGCATAVEL